MYVEKINLLNLFLKILDVKTNDITHYISIHSL
jgi:hypothetical protein